RTQYGLFKYLVIPFGLINTLSSFQYYINNTLHPYIRIFFFLGTLSQAKIGVCKTCVSRDFSDLRQLAAICYKYIGYPCKLPQIAT
ncbi:uncharacterized protein K441DRAFT_710141, partial [Cenococcum geophilum 1.58]|uniref:uncharacterized protein n=1 Tax=Cenococcum geophilum 1.58 TaxID=794803 RepID=UPI00358FDA35